MALSLVAVVVSTRCRWCRVQGLPVVLRGVFRPFRPLSCFPLPVIVLYYALFRVLRAFLEGFVVRMYICMGCVLCVAYGAFVRVSG